MPEQRITGIEPFELGSPQDRRLLAVNDPDLRAAHEFDILGFSDTVPAGRMDALEDCPLDVLHEEISQEYRLSEKDMRKVVGMCRQFIRKKFDVQ